MRISERFIEAATWGCDKNFNHVVIECSEDLKQAVKTDFSGAYTRAVIKEMRSLYEQYGNEIGLYVDNEKCIQDFWDEDPEECVDIKFVVTGKLKYFENREEIVDYIEDLGGIVSGSVSSKTDYLICNNPESKSSKIKKAEELGVEIISEAEFIKRFGDVDEYDVSEEGFFTFDTNEICNYEVAFENINEGWLITYPEPIYVGSSGDINMGESLAIEKALIDISNLHPDLKYYGYEGYFVSDVHGSEVYQKEFGSTGMSPKEKYAYVESVLQSVWGDAEFWKQFEDLLINENDVESIINTINVYGSALGETPMSLVMEHVGESIKDFLTEKQ